MIAQKGYIHSERDIESLFEQKYREDTAIHDDVVQKMKQIKDRNIS